MNIKKVKDKVVIGLSLLAITGCSSANKIHYDSLQASKSDDSTMDSGYLIISDDQRAAINKGNTFAVNLFKSQIDFSSKVVSPLSVSYLMGMLANGAEGTTQKEILKTLGVGDMSLNSLNEAYRVVLNTASKLDKSTTINIANCIAVDKGIDLKKDFTHTVSTMYDAKVESLDFSNPKSKDKINTWCNSQTNGMIPSIIDQLSPSDVSVLMNAIYFDGSWTSKFEKSQTKEENFRGYTRDIKRVKMMHQNDKFDYLDSEKFEAVNLPYGNRSYTMTVLLPKDGVSIEEMMSTLDAEKIRDIRRNMENCIVDLKLPKFTTSTETTLNNSISKLGASSMFSSSAANFKNMSDANVYVSKMLQKAKIEVSEEGTKAAAVTTAMVAMTSLKPDEPRRVNFHANRPFVYVITDNKCGAIFFIGQYLGD